MKMKMSLVVLVLLSFNMASAGPAKKAPRKLASETITCVLSLPGPEDGLKVIDLNRIAAEFPEQSKVTLSQDFIKRYHIKNDVVVSGMDVTHNYSATSLDDDLMVLASAEVEVQNPKLNHSEIERIDFAMTQFRATAKDGSNGAFVVTIGNKQGRTSTSGRLKCE